MVDKLYFLLVMLVGGYVCEMLLVWLVVCMGNLYLVLLYCLDWLMVGLVLFLICLVMCDVY